MRQVLLYLWALPTTCVGLPFLLLAWFGGGRAKMVCGVVEVHGRWIAKFLEHIPIIGGAAAMTLGHIVIGRNAVSLEETRNHERVHVRQVERWGPLFIPAYLFASAIAKIRGLHPYLDNSFEREAYGISK